MIFTFVACSWSGARQEERRGRRGRRCEWAMRADIGGKSKKGKRSEGSNSRGACGLGRNGGGRRGSLGSGGKSGKEGAQIVGQGKGPQGFNPGARDFCAAARDAKDSPFTPLAPLHTPPSGPFGPLHAPFAILRTPLPSLGVCPSQCFSPFLLHFRSPIRACWPACSRPVTSGRAELAGCCCVFYRLCCPRPCRTRLSTGSSSLFSWQMRCLAPLTKQSQPITTRRRRRPRNTCRGQGTRDPNANTSLQPR